MFALVDSMANPFARHPGQRVRVAGRNLGAGTNLDPEQNHGGESQLTGRRSDNGRDFVVDSPAADSLDGH